MSPGVLYISYDGMLEPLGQSQVLAYLERLAAGRRMHLISFEKRAEWARAMVLEMEHIEGDRAALRWSFGCVLASYREGLRMTRSDLVVSRWLLGISTNSDAHGRDTIGATAA